MEADELQWYTEQAARLDKFKAALHALRLQPDEFHALLRGHSGHHEGSDDS